MWVILHCYFNAFTVKIGVEDSIWSTVSIMYCVLNSKFHGINAKFLCNLINNRFYCKYGLWLSRRSVSSCLRFIYNYIKTVDQQIVYLVWAKTAHCSSCYRRTRESASFIVQIQFSRSY